MSALSAASTIELFVRDTCSGNNEYDGRMGVRISSIFVILVAGTFGACFPYAASVQSGLNIPSWMFFVAKYFGSGVIVATAFIHLLQPANEALTNECLGEGWQLYPYAFGISLVALFTMFFIEILSFKLLVKHGDGSGHSHGPAGLMGDAAPVPLSLIHSRQVNNPICDNAVAGDINIETESCTGSSSDIEACMDSDHSDQDVEKLGFSDSKETTHLHEHTHHHHHNHNHSHQGGLHNADHLATQLTSIFILEFGIIFHSVFVGLTLAVSGAEFTSLYIVIVFHQMFEGLGLGSRLAGIKWPPSYRWTPWCLGLAFGLTTPICIAIGLGIRTSYPPNSATSLITNGIFDSVSSGILIYTGLVELMANEFLFSPEFQYASIRRIMAAFFSMCCGAALMALLGRWA